MITGETLRDRGIYRVSKNTPVEWKEAAMSIIMTLVANGNEITAEDVREWVGDPPNAPQAMGAVMRTAVLAGIIVPTGFVTAKRKERHAGVLRTFRRAE